MKSSAIKAERVRCGYTQSEAAQMLGIPVSRFRAKEWGVSMWTDEEKVRLTEIYGLSVHQMNEYLYNGILPLDKLNAGPVQSHI